MVLGPSTCPVEAFRAFGRTYPTKGPVRASVLSPGDPGGDTTEAPVVDLTPGVGPCSPGGQTVPVPVTQKATTATSGPTPPSVRGGGVWTTARRGQVWRALYVGTRHRRRGLPSKMEVLGPCPLAAGRPVHWPERNLGYCKTTVREASTPGRPTEDPGLSPLRETHGIVEVCLVTS